MMPDNRRDQGTSNPQQPNNQAGPYNQGPVPPYGQGPIPPNRPYQPYNPNQGQNAYGPPPGYQPPPLPGNPKKKPINPVLLWGGLIGTLVVVAAVAVLIIIPIFNRSTRTEADPFAASNGGVAAVATVPNTAAAGAATTTNAAATGTTKNTVAPTAAPAAAPRPTTAPAAANVPPTQAKPGGGAQVLGKGEFNKIDAIHYARGTATLGVGADGKKVLRFDNFTSAQGPDLKVYLGARPDGSKVKEGGLNLGALPATDGSYNINIPDNADLTKYKSVVIWCEAFSVTFSVASLS